jgi:transcriptional regulator with XRE-family HTH domain
MKAKEHRSEAIARILAQITPQQKKRIETRMLLAAKIADAMRTKGWKNKDLARQMNVSPSLVTKWLSGTNNFTSDVLSDLSDVLNIQLFDVDRPRLVEPQVAVFVEVSIPQRNRTDLNRSRTLPKSVIAMPLYGEAPMLSWSNTHPFPTA